MAVGVTILGSGSHGNALVVHDEQDGILIDAGFSARELGRRLELAGLGACRIRAILVSHEHADHVSGLGPVARQTEAPVYLNRGTAEAVRERDNAPERLQIFASGSRFMVEDFRIEPFSIPHDAMDPVGFTVHWRGVKVGVATDLGHVNNHACHQLRECDLLVIESNHDIAMLRDSHRPWSIKQRILGRHGHLSNEASMELVRRVLHARTRHLVMAHASQECNRYDLVEACVARCLRDAQRPDVHAVVARQDEITPTLWL